MTTSDATNLALWSDDPAPVDLLSFDAVAATLADALLDPSLDPVALGLSGSWGSGKTTVLGLVARDLENRGTNDQKVLVIETEPWRYDPATGAKETLIGEVLAALATEVEQSQTTSQDIKDKAIKLAKRLAKRIDWAKAIKLAANTSLTLQLPSIDNIVDLVKPAEGSGDEDAVRGLEAFRSEFRELMASEPLSHLIAVAVLVDDLDRCLPETVVESLEAVRLFLAVPKMSFVIAADEDRVADAIRTRFADSPPTPAGGQESEEPAKLYLHKIVQTTIPLPTLSRFDTQAYLLLLQLQQKLPEDQLSKVVAECERVRRAGGGLDDLEGLNDFGLTEELAFASRLTPILYEKLHGNPRRIKRFLNDLGVRRTIAARRGISLDPAVVAKLMVLEVLLPEEFSMVLDWLAQGSLRDQVSRLEQAAGRSTVDGETTASDASDDGAVATEHASPEETVSTAATDFTEGLIRWAKLPPPLNQIDLSPYLLLAASFSGKVLLDTSLPERLRDVAANLLSSARADRQAVTDADIDGLTTAEAEMLLVHIGRTIRDQPMQQKTGVTAILRIARLRPTAAAPSAKALLMLPPDDLSVGTPLLFAANDPEDVFRVLTAWYGQTSGAVKAAVKNALDQRSGA